MSHNVENTINDMHNVILNSRILNILVYFTSFDYVAFTSLTVKNNDLEKLCVFLNYQPAVNRIKMGEKIYLLVKKTFNKEYVTGIRTMVC